MRYKVVGSSMLLRSDRAQRGFQPQSIIKSTRGSALMQAMVAVGILTLVSAGIAGAVKSGLDGLSYLRNSQLADDATLLVSSLMSDPNFCKAHFLNRNISSSLPAQIATVPSINGIKPDGTLDASPIISVGTSYQNKLPVTGMNLVAEHRTGSGRYSGHLKMVFSGGIPIVRSVPMGFVVDSFQRITSCSRTLEAEENQMAGEWSMTCDDFAEKGWPSKEACMQDGKWHLGLKNTSTGNHVYGSISQLEGYIRNGAEVRVAFEGQYGFGASYDTCASIATHSGKIICMVPARPGVPNIDTHTISAPQSHVYFSDGVIVIGGSPVRGDMDWQVKW